MKILFDTTIALYHKNIAFVNTDVNKWRGYSMIADPCFHVHVGLCLVASCHAFFGVDLEPDRPFSVLSIPEEVTRHSLLKKIEKEIGTMRARSYINDKYYTHYYYY